MYSVYFIAEFLFQDLLSLSRENAVPKSQDKFKIPLGSLSVSLKADPFWDNFRSKINTFTP